MKKLLSLILTIGIGMNSLATAQAWQYVPNVAGFSDVNQNSTYFEAILYLKEKGLISGYSDNTFRPDQVINRAETLKMIMGIKEFKVWEKTGVTLTAETDAFKPEIFSDIKVNEWYMPYLKDAYNQGLVQGYPDRTFHPSSNVNKVEALKMLLLHTTLRGLDMGVEDNELIPYSDVDKEAWYSLYVNIGWKKNVLVVKNNMIHPGADLTRGELAEMIYRVLLTDENGWTKYQNITVEAEFKSPEESLKSAKLLVDGSEVGDVFIDNYSYPRITMIVGTKVFISYSPTVFGMETFQYNPPSKGSAVYDLSTNEFTVMKSFTIEDISKDRKTLLAHDHNGDNSRFLLVDTDTLKEKETIFSWPILADKQIIDAGDLSFSPDNNKIAWAERYLLKSNSPATKSGTSEEVIENFIKVYDVKNKTTETFFSNNNQILRVTGWDKNDNPTYVIESL